MSQIVLHEKTVYLSGQVAVDMHADITVQTQQVLAKIDALLSRAGSDKSKLLSATIWLSSMENFAAMNVVWDAWVAPGQCPARACVEAKLARAEFAVEIGVIAARA